MNGFAIQEKWKPAMKGGPWRKKYFPRFLFTRGREKGTVSTPVSRSVDFEAW